MHKKWQGCDVPFAFQVLNSLETTGICTFRGWETPFSKALIIPLALSRTPISQFHRNLIYEAKEENGLTNVSSLDGANREGFSMLRRWSQDASLA